jgi:hypothetical protein
LQDLNLLEYCLPMPLLIISNTSNELVYVEQPSVLKILKDQIMCTSSPR